MVRGEIKKRGNEMKVIGLTGGTGSGKSVVSKSLAAAGAVVIDADKIAHEIILKGEPAYQEIVKYYGTGILDAKGNIIRRRLGEIVFHDAEKLANHGLWFVRRWMRFIAARRSHPAIPGCAVLLEAGYGLGGLCRSGGARKTRDGTRWCQL